MRTLQQCLLDLDIAHLRYIARYWDLDETGRQHELAGNLAEAMAAPEHVQETWEALPPGEKQALDAVLAASGRIPYRVLAREWGEIRHMGPGRMAREKPWDEPASAAEGLWLKGFISRAFDRTGSESYEVVFVPRELVPLLPVPETQSTQINLTPVSPPNVVFSAGDAFLDDVCSILAYIQNTPVHAKADGTWPADHEAHIRAQLRNDSADRLALLQHIVQRLGWLHETGSKRVRPDPEKVTTWLQSSQQEQHKAIAAGWRDDPTWNELFHIYSLRPENISIWRNDPLTARHAVLHHLGDRDPDTWYRVSDFTMAVKRVDPDFQRPSGDYESWYIRDLTTNAYLSGFDSWSTVEGSLIQHTITGPLAWLGLTDVGAETPDSPISAFRITRQGAAMLGQQVEQVETSEERVILRPDFSAFVPASQRYNRFQLARIADWVSSGEIFTYRITPRTLERARQQGITITRVLDFLQQVTDAPVPRTIEAALTRWDARGTESHIDQVILLTMASDELMLQVVESPLSRQLIKEQISPTVALVRQKDWPLLAIALGKMGLLPEITVGGNAHKD